MSTYSQSSYTSSVFEYPLKQQKQHNNTPAMENTSAMDSFLYDQRIKEIERYYLSTLLNDSNGGTTTPSNDYEYEDDNFMLTKENIISNKNTDSMAPHNDLYELLSSLSISQRPFNDFPTNNTGGLYSSFPFLNVEINKNVDTVPIDNKDKRNLSVTSTVSTKPNFVEKEFIQQEKVLYQQDLSSRNVAKQVNKSLYKTELCETFTTTGDCKYGSKCQFAHGLHELKIKEINGKNYRTKPCHNWKKYGVCPYGNRCVFKHGDNDDIKVYLQAGTIKVEKDGSATTRKKSNISTKYASPSVVAKKNDFANVKVLSGMNW
ncbi:uncharacterized protein SCODWIG_03420 [Saccharomycodes ludwigii]|uniref:C3H1-type domain-containing protein n=1 Tax=Saccharomycodes ludwigii TaxID=36035 RepID=A0A376BAP4_9ASCO|nr:hypothetical protein SCDLUD_001776 [Saccharomycodes ludwigii]KAH3901988.1 hypothetical protein SCDLUD_001776 [Saccharomycodes ludwigii]SSD61659.1 uncharacterized protein SCODWIG_03420 [Saccharomycodes ludwigii]